MQSFVGQYHRRLISVDFFFFFPVTVRIFIFIGQFCFQLVMITDKISS